MYGSEGYGSCREFYYEYDRIPLHMKLDIPEGFSAKEEASCPLVIVQHGFTGDMEEDHIKAAARALNESGFATLRTELYGHGKSGGDFMDHDLFKWLLEMTGIIDYVKTWDFISDLWLCGHSQGGLAVMLAAAMKKDEIRGIIPLSPATMIPEEARGGILLGHQFDPEHVPDVITLDDGLQVKGNHIRVSRMLYVEPAIEEYTGSVLLIHGDEDETVPYRCAVDAAQRYQNAELVTIRGADHCFNGHLEEVIGAVKSFIKNYASVK